MQSLHPRDLSNFFFLGDFEDQRRVEGKHFKFAKEFFLIFYLSPSFLSLSPSQVGNGR